MISDSSRQSLRREIHVLGLDSYSETIVTAARTAIRLRPTERDDGPDVSRLGGTATLPAGTTWPSWKGRPLALIAQIMLRDVSPFDLEGLLPKTGRLLFFYDPEQETWGFDPSDKGSWAVTFVSDMAETEGAEGTRSETYKSVRLAASAEIALPPWESLWFEGSRIDPEATDAYLELREKLNAGGELIHKMLGYPDPVQGEMQTECQLASNGVYCGTAEGSKDPRAKSLRVGASEWRPLLQIDSDEDMAGMMWGDLGRLYYWIREHDLARRAFGSSWFVLQCG